MDARKNAHINAHGFIIEVKADCVNRYTYSKKRKDGKGKNDVLNDIEKNQLIILDEDSGRNKEYGWYDVIDVNTLEGKIDADTMLSSLSNDLRDEIDRDILNQLTRCIEEQKLKDEEEKKSEEKYKKFVLFAKQPPWSIADENIPSYEDWRMGNK
jgi:hypothetical protein